ncbi:MAG: 30S ribosomal protein S10 [Thiovulaceae bacterium]|nr:30S ribosomal protein S10 [Sulfurimonadaceae bacterium]
MEKIRLKLKAYDHRVLDRSVTAIVDAVKRTGAEIRGPIPMPTRIRKYTVLKSPHVNKKSREQFEIRIHGRVIDIVSATPDTVDSLMKLDLAPEVDVEVRSMANKEA